MMLKNLILAALLLLHTNAPQRSETLVQWSYPYNNATYRTYTAYNAKIKYISESGDNGFIEFDGTDGPLDEVTLYGRAFDGQITLEPTVSNCWRLAIHTDYSTLNWVKQSAAPCYRVYFAIGNR